MTLLPHWPSKVSKLALTALAAALLCLCPYLAVAGGPKYVAGVSYFNPGVLGQPVIWANGQVSYFVDQGPLNSTISNTQATAMVDAAAALWSAVPTAAVSLTDRGSLAEDVNGSNVQAVSGAFAYPSDITPSASGTPIAVIFDADGSVIDALEGSGASIPTNCTENSVLVWIDNMNPNATFAHAVIVLNGRCATTSGLLAMMNFQLERAFGRILGLDFSQVNMQAEKNDVAEPNGTLAWPVMQPLSGNCGVAGGVCIPNPSTLRIDDIAALSRLYTITSANQSSFPGKVLTAANTVSIQGNVTFSDGSGMQGVNVIARPLDQNGNPLYQYTVTFVSGAYFAGNHGNAITGWVDQQGNRLDRFGSNNPALQGSFDLSCIPLPPGVTSASYQVSFESINPLYINSNSVGPYLQGSPTASGNLQSIVVSGLSAGQTHTVMANAIDSANGAIQKVIGVARAKGAAVKPFRPVNTGTVVQPTLLPQAGVWTSRLGQVGASDWFVLPVRGNRLFTVVTQALDETGTPTNSKAMPALGVWDGFDPAGVAAPGSTTAANGIAIGETWLQVATSGKDVVRLGIADQRGDGRPDYLYRGWVLYADTVSPARLPATGGQIVIRGTGFRAGDTVQVGGVAATVVSTLPTEITALVPGTTLTGSVDVEVDDLPGFNALAVIPSGISFDAGAGDALNLVRAPAGQIALNVPQPFIVIAKGADGQPAANVTVTFAVTSGTATLGCGATSCAVSAAGDGRATMTITPTSSSAAIVTASLLNGSSIQSHFYGATPAALTAITPTLYIAAGASASWPVQAIVQNAGTPVAGQQVAWQTASGIAAPSGAVATAANGVAAASLTVGPLSEGQTAVSTACLSGTQTCATFSAFGSRPEYAVLSAVSGTGQSMAVGTAAQPITMRVLDMNGNPMAAATVTIHQALYAWTAPCPRHGRCAAAQLLSSSATTLTSALDGSVSFTPLSLPGTATNLTGIAATGNAGTLNFAIEQHP